MVECFSGVCLEKEIVFYVLIFFLKQKEHISIESQGETLNCTLS